MTQHQRFMATMYSNSGNVVEDLAKLVGVSVVSACVHGNRMWWMVINLCY